MLIANILVVHAVFIALAMLVRRYLLRLDKGLVGLYMVFVPTGMATFLSLSPWLILFLMTIGLGALLYDCKTLAASADERTGSRSIGRSM